MGFNKSHKVAILKLTEFGPNRRGNWGSEKLLNIGVNAFQPDEVHFPLGDPRQLRVREEILPNIAVAAGELNERRDLARLEIVPETQTREKQPTNDSGGLKEIEPMLHQEIEKLH